MRHKTTLHPRVTDRDEIVSQVNKRKKAGFTHIFLTVPETGKEGLILANKFSELDYERIKRNIVY